MFGVEHPIVLAPMGGVAGGELAAAVSQAGGLGLVGGGYGRPSAAGYGGEEWLMHEMDAAGNARVGIGFITWTLAERPHLLDLALDRSPAAVMLSFGDMRPFVDRIKKAGAKLIAQVQTLKDAREAAALGADVIVAQGTEAGGHGRIGRATLTLVPAVVDAVAPVPVLAAGGIADGRGLAAALMLGASGVLVGTRFFASREALGSPNAKRRIVESAGDSTVRTRVFDIVRELDWPDGFTGRAIANEFSNRWHGREDGLASALAEERNRYAEASAAGNVDVAVVFAGECIDLIDDEPPAGDIVRRMAAEAEHLLGGGWRTAAS